jgi:hypothetical protein
MKNFLQRDTLDIIEKTEQIVNKSCSVKVRNDPFTTFNDELSSMRMPINNGSTNLLKHHRQFQLKRNWVEKVNNIKNQETIFRKTGQYPPSMQKKLNDSKSMDNFKLLKNAINYDPNRPLPQKPPTKDSNPKMPNAAEAIFEYPEPPAFLRESSKSSFSMASPYHATDENNIKSCRINRPLRDPVKQLYSRGIITGNLQSRYDDVGVNDEDLEGQGHGELKGGFGKKMRSSVIKQNFSRKFDKFISNNTQRSSGKGDVRDVKWAKRLPCMKKKDPSATARNFVIKDHNGNLNMDQFFTDPVVFKKQKFEEREATKTSRAILHKEVPRIQDIMKSCYTTLPRANLKVVKDILKSIEDGTYGEESEDEEALGFI